MKVKAKIIKTGPLVTIEVNPALDSLPILWNFAVWLLRFSAKQNDLSRSYVSKQIHQINFQINNDIQNRFDANKLL